MNRAYSQLTIKGVSEESRTFEGIASTPNSDRSEDIVEPMGAKFTLPIPMMWNHGKGDMKDPVGWITHAMPQKDGIYVKGKFAKVDSPPTLKEDLDRAWTLVREKLVRGLSIGFRPIKSEPIKGTFGERIKEWDWFELSPVSIPANADASITAIKSADQAMRAASGQTQSKTVHLTSSGDSGNTTSKGTTMKSIQEQIASFEAKRAASSNRMNEVMSKAADEGRTLDETETQEYDGLKAEIKAVDDHLVRLREHETVAIAKATKVTAEVTAEPKAASQVRSGIISVRQNVEKGIAFTRYVKAMAMARGNVMHAHAIAESNQEWKETTPQVAVVLKSAVSAGDTTSSGWASELVYNQDLVAEFIDLLRPMTIIGRITNLTRVPFNVRMSGQNSGSTAYWVGQGAAVPVSALGTTEVTLGQAKAAGLVVLTEELVRSSSPSAELLVRNDLAKSISQFLDVQFVDPNFAAVTNVSPASITNGVTPVTPSGTNAAAARADVQTLFNSYITNNLDPSGAVWIMTPTTALALSLMQNPLGQPEFSTINMNGGTWFGLPVITSNSANIAGSPDSGRMIILANAPEILLADDGQVTIDASREASLEMDTAPGNKSVTTSTPAQLVSMFQTNSVAIRAVRFINWKKRRSTAVAYIREAAYTA